MKRIFYVSMAAAAVFAFASCSDDKEYVAPLSIEEAMVVFDSNGGEGIVLLSKAGIEAEAIEEWCTLSVDSNKVIVNVAVNDGMMGRNSRLRITQGGDAVYVTVTQEGVNMRIEPMALSFGSPEDSDEITVDVSADVPIVASSSETWLETAIEGNKLTVSVDENAEFPNRSGVITVTAGELAREVSVTQLGRPMTEDEVFGKYTVTGSSFYAPSPRIYDVEIVKQGNSIFRIKGIPWGMTYTFFVNVDYERKTLSCESRTNVTPTSQGLKVWSIGEKDIVINVDAPGEMSTPEPASVSEYWGIGIPDLFQWAVLFDGPTTWTRTAP